MEFTGVQFPGRLLILNLKFQAMTNQFFTTFQVKVQFENFSTNETEVEVDEIKAESLNELCAEIWTRYGVLDFEILAQRTYREVFNF